LVLEGNYLEAIEKFYLAKSLKSVEACFQLGQLYENGCSDMKGIVLSQDLSMAMRFYKEAGDKGHQKALLRLASIMICGPAEFLDTEKAVEALKKAATPNTTVETEEFGLEAMSNLLGDADAQNMLGELCEIGLHNGLEGKEDAYKALDWYRLALKQGHNRAMFNMGALYEKGVAVEKDIKKASRFYLEVMFNLFSRQDWEIEMHSKEF
jgi:TPR repeat protein